MHSQQPGLEIEAMNPKLEVLREAQSVSVAEPAWTCLKVAAFSPLKMGIGEHGAFR